MTISFETDNRIADESEAPLERRPTWLSIRRGLACRCPNCGTGKLFNGYLKVVPTCANCGEDLSHHRADDLPPYLTMVIVGHLIVPIILYVETHSPLSTFVSLAIWLPLTLIMCLALLRPVKGGVVGLQWALRMHGFDRNSSGGESFDDPDMDDAPVLHGNGSASLAA